MNRLLIPAWHYRACAVVERVWGWSPAEEAVLLSLNRAPGSSEDVASALDLPRQVVSAAVARLMHHGLLDFRLEGQPALVLSEAGNASIHSGLALPERTEHRELGISLVYEKLGHSIFRFKNVRGCWRNTKFKRADAYRIEIPKNEPVETYETMEERAWYLVRKSLRTGEMEHSIQTTDARLVPGLLEIDLDDAQAGVFPEGTKPELREAVHRIVASKKTPRLKVTKPNGYPSEQFETTFHPDQLILGGPAQLDRAEAIIDAAQADIFILSTFVASQNDQKQRAQRERLWSALDRAVERGVRCHLFYGTSTDGVEQHTQAIEELRVRLCKVARATEDVLVHYRSIHSHTKLLAADDGVGGAVVALGSCNWLQSPFRACELSIELRKGEAAAQGLDLFAAVLSNSPEATRSIDTLRAMAAEVRRQRSSVFKLGPQESMDVRASMKLVLAHQHDPLLRKVAHGKHHQIMCASHRLGATMVPAIFNPLRTNQLDVGERRVLYSRVSGPTKKRHVRAEKEKHEKQVTTLSLRNPEIHAKFLLWGTDDFVVTSMNWGSQQGDVSAPYDEVGVHVTAPGAATSLLEALKEHLPQLSSI